MRVTPGFVKLRTDVGGFLLNIGNTCIFILSSIIKMGKANDIKVQGVLSPPTDEIVERVRYMRRISHTLVNARARAANYPEIAVSPEPHVMSLSQGLATVPPAVDGEPLQNLILTLELKSPHDDTKATETVFICIILH